MKDMHRTYLNFNDVCLYVDVEDHIVIEIIEHGIVEPTGLSCEDWLFSHNMVLVTKKAVRLHRDLDMDWPGIALAIELLDEIKELRERNNYLEQRLSRFVDS